MRPAIERAAGELLDAIAAKGRPAETDLMGVRSTVPRPCAFVRTGARSPFGSDWLLSNRG